MTLVASNKNDLSNIIVRIDIKQIYASLYSYSVSFGGEPHFEDCGYTSIADALLAASSEGGEFLGYEVAYRGITIGTYQSIASAADAEFIAQAAVDTIASLYS